VPDLLRPEPPRSLFERLAALRAALHPARVATAVGSILLLVVAAWWLLRAPRPRVEDQLPRASTTAPAASSIAAEETSSSVAPALIVVQVAGAVARPGVYQLTAGARVIDLIDAAGGAAPDADLEAMALASHLADGQRIQVPHRGEVLPAEATGARAAATATGPSDSSPSGPLDLNSATPDQLDALPGIGPATAQAIVGYRTNHGPFRSVDDLTEVQGIGPAKLEALRDLVRV
jgi:competence protein ComEA